MDNIVRLGGERPRRPRALDVPQSGARILFFTGVRYCRDEEDALPAVPEAHVIDGHGRHAAESGLALDRAAH